MSVRLPTADEPVLVVCGDALDVLRSLPKACADVIATDPPYGINTKSDGNDKLSPWADYLNAAHWYTAWIGECRRVLKPTGCLWSCLNWRSIVTFQKAACDLGWPIESLLVWDKRWIGPGGAKGLRPSYEMVALWAQPVFTIDNRSLADVQPFPWSAHKPSGHPAEKPVELMTFCVRNATTPGALVVDPFLGSGTTGVAAVAAGCRFLGVDMDQRWADAGRLRVNAALGIGGLFQSSPPPAAAELFA